MTFATTLAARGMSSAAAESKGALFERAQRALGTGRDEDSLAVFVPGRIEVLGKHTDYAGGRSLLCAAERGMCLVARRRTDNCVVATDVVSGTQAHAVLDGDSEAVSSGWELYLRTVARRLARNFPSARQGADIAFGSDLPVAAGMSSSSALVTSLLLALADINDVPASDAYLHAIGSKQDLAEYLGTIENGQDFRQLKGDAGVGTFGGSEDHTAMLCCEAAALSQYRFCPVRHERQVPVPGGFTFVVAVSGVVAEKTGAARDTYNRASLAARRVLQAWNAAGGRHDPTLAAAVEAAGHDEIRAVLPDDLVDRFDQFYDETFVIIPQVAQALCAGRIEAIGHLVDRSQRGAERGLRNQVPETVFLADSARQLGAVASSAFGAGFGGSVWAMVTSSAAPAFAERWSSAYADAFPQRASRAQFFATGAGPAAMRLG